MVWSASEDISSFILRLLPVRPRRANLSTAQIVEQVVTAKRLLAADGAPGEGGITNVVFMVRFACKSRRGL